MTNDVALKRAYERPAKADGKRVLVERLWPRGLSKDEARIDAWLKDIAPSSELRTWYGHEVERWPEFRRRYETELRHNAEAVEELLHMVRQGKTTFVYGARDQEHNSAVVLRGFIMRRLRSPRQAHQSSKRTTSRGTKR